MPIPGLPISIPSISPSSTATATVGPATTDQKVGVTTGTGDGLRGFQNNIAFPGATQTTSNDINQPSALVGKSALWLAGLAVLILGGLYLLWKKR